MTYPYIESFLQWKRSLVFRFHRTEFVHRHFEILQTRRLPRYQSHTLSDSQIVLLFDLSLGLHVLNTWLTSFTRVYIRL